MHATDGIEPTVPKAHPTEIRKRRFFLFVFLCFILFLTYAAYSERTLSHKDFVEKDNEAILIIVQELKQNGPDMIRQLPEVAIRNTAMTFVIGRRTGQLTGDDLDRMGGLIGATRSSLTGQLKVLGANTGSNQRRDRAIAALNSSPNIVEERVLAYVSMNPHVQRTGKIKPEQVFPYLLNMGMSEEEGYAFLMERSALTEANKEYRIELIREQAAAKQKNYTYEIYKQRAFKWIKNLISWPSS